MRLRLLGRADAEAFQKLRREALQDSPRSFSESVAEHDTQPLEAIAKRLSESPEHFVIGAVHLDKAGEHLIGMAGFARNPRAKLHHKALIWGVYVAPTFRGQGIARALISEIIRRARAMNGVLQIKIEGGFGTPASRLYQSLGFEVYGTERRALHVDGAFIDNDEMVLRLDTVS